MRKIMVYLSTMLILLFFIAGCSLIGLAVSTASQKNLTEESSDDDFIRQYYFITNKEASAGKGFIGIFAEGLYGIGYEIPLKNGKIEGNGKHYYTYIETVLSKGGKVPYFLDDPGFKFQIPKKYPDGVDIESEDGFVRGLLKSEEEYVNGKLSGIRKNYSIKGFLVSETPYKEGKMDGLVKVYYPKGEKKCEVSVVENKISSDRKCYYEDGKLKSILTFKNNLPKEQKIYDKNGKLEKVVIYRADMVSDIKPKDDNDKWWEKKINVDGYSVFNILEYLENIIPDEFDGKINANYSFMRFFAGGFKYYNNLHDSAKYRTFLAGRLTDRGYIDSGEMRIIDIRRDKEVNSRTAIKERGPFVLGLVIEGEKTFFPNGNKKSESTLKNSPAATPQYFRCLKMSISEDKCNDMKSFIREIRYNKLAYEEVAYYDNGKIEAKAYCKNTDILLDEKNNNVRVEWFNNSGIFIMDKEQLSSSYISKGKQRIDKSYVTKYTKKNYYGQTLYTEYNKSGSIKSEKQYDICMVHLDGNVNYKNSHLKSLVEYDDKGVGYYKAYDVADVKSTGKKNEEDMEGVVAASTYKVIITEEGPMKNYKKDGVWFSYNKDESLYAKVEWQAGNVIKGECASGRQWTPVEMRKWANDERVNCQ